MALPVFQGGVDAFLFIGLYFAITNLDIWNNQALLVLNAMIWNKIQKEDLL